MEKQKEGVRIRKTILSVLVSSDSNLSFQGFQRLKHQQAAAAICQFIAEIMDYQNNKAHFDWTEMDHRGPFQQGPSFRPKWTLERKVENTLTYERKTHTWALQSALLTAVADTAAAREAACATVELLPILRLRLVDFISRYIPLPSFFFFFD